MNKRRVFIALGCFFVLCAIGCGFYVYLRTSYTPPVLSETIAPPTASPVPSPTPTPKPTARPTHTPIPTPVPTPTPEPYVCPVDFGALQSVNSDIYAWLQVGGTEINYPVLQHGSDNGYYLTHDSDGNYSANGALFTQSAYNGRSFDDPVTVIYGHRMGSGSMFGNLKNDFSNWEFFNNNRSITVYLPDKKLDYKIFAAVPYSNEHILYQHNFSNENEFNAFFDNIFSITEEGAQLDPSARPAFGDKIVVLSTCLQVNRSRRFLVMGALVP